MAMANQCVWVSPGVFGSSGLTGQPSASFFLPKAVEDTTLRLLISQ